MKLKNFMEVLAVIQNHIDEQVVNVDVDEDYIRLRVNDDGELTLELRA